MVYSGLRDAGYDYVIVEDGWADYRDANGVIHPNPRFPNMTDLGDYLHRNGLKFGIYTDGGTRTCLGFPGSYGFEAEDAATYASWGVDYVIYDWCYAVSDPKATTEIMHKAILATGRPMVLSVSAPAYDPAGGVGWVAAAGGNLWRFDHDIGWSGNLSTFEGMMGIAKDDSILSQYAGPGHWNHPDYLIVGLIVPGESNQFLGGQPSLSEQKVQISLWAILAAPMIVSSKIEPESLDLLLNREAIAVSQDVGGRQGTMVGQSGAISYWARPLSDGSEALAIVNEGENEGIGRVSGTYRMRDIWAHVDLGLSPATFVIPPHDVLMIRATPVGSR